MARCWVSVLVDVLEQYDGAVLGHPADLLRDGHDVAPGAGWPATPRALVKLLTSRADELATIGLLVHWTPPGPGQPAWLAVTDVSAPPRVPPRLPASSYLPAWTRGRPKAGHRVPGK